MNVFNWSLSNLLLLAAQQYVKAHVVVVEEECWIATTSGDGRYKHFWFCGQRFKAHVLSWLAFRGPLARHHVVDHEYCNRTDCCNPWHLNAVSQSANIKRCFAVGRGKSPFIKDTTS
jgi:hypothetical protein